MSIKVFLDTNTLISFFNTNIFELEVFRGYCDIEFVTFEKCIYEWKNGIKRHLINIDFLISTIKGDFSNNDYESSVAKSIIYRAIDNLGIDCEEINHKVPSVCRTLS